MILAHDRVGSRSLRRQALVEPRQRRRDPGILVAQPMDELDCEGVGSGRVS